MNEMSLLKIKSVSRKILLGLAFSFFIFLGCIQSVFFMKAILVMPCWRISSSFTLIIIFSAQFATSISKAFNVLSIVTYKDLILPLVFQFLQSIAHCQLMQDYKWAIYKSILQIISESIQILSLVHFSTNFYLTAEHSNGNLK